MLEYKAFKEAVTRNLLDQGSAIEMESMLARVGMQSIGEDVRELQRATISNESMFREKIQKVLMSEGPEGGVSSNPEVEEARKKKLDEQLDSKIQNAFEKLRNDNLFIWK